MRVRSRAVFGSSFALFFSVLFWEAVAMAQGFPTDHWPQESRSQWEAVEKMLLEQYRVCAEHCGKDKACLERCDQVRQNRLETEYRDLSGKAASPSPMHEDIKRHPSCPYCGMDREKFSHSRMLILYEDGSEVGTCSLHCVAVELALKIDQTPKALTVGDYNSKKLIDAEKAYWVMGGGRPGVMTKRAKWAFERKEDAERFIQENGGQLVTFEEALKASYEDMYNDTKMIRDRRKARRMQQHTHQ